MILCRPLPCNRRAVTQAVASSPPWDPTTPGTPNRWRSAEDGKLWTNAGKTTAAGLGDAVYTVEALVGSDMVQSSATLRPYVATLGSRWAVRSDNVDDNTGNNDSVTAGAKTYGVIFEIFSAPGASSAETILRIGSSPNQIILRHSGLSSSAAKGFHFGFDRSTTSQVCIQDSAGPALLSNGVHTVVIRYDGVSATSASSYRCWLDGVEITLTTGGNMAASGFGRWLATSVPAEVCDCSIGEDVLYYSALAEADCIALSAYLEAMR